MSIESPFRLDFYRYLRYYDPRGYDLATRGKKPIFSAFSLSVLFWLDIHTESTVQTNE